VCSLVANVWGGLGRDTYSLSSSVNADYQYYVNDFATGTDGDVINISSLLSASGYTGPTNPFLSGNPSFQLVQNGADAQLKWDRDGAGGSPAYVVLTLRNTPLNQLTADNFISASNTAAMAQNTISTGMFRVDNPDFSDASPSTVSVGVSEVAISGNSAKAQSIANHLNSLGHNTLVSWFNLSADGVAQNAATLNLTHATNVGWSLDASRIPDLKGLSTGDALTLTYTINVQNGASVTP
jgi:hypothetical protein